MSAMQFTGTFSVAISRQTGKFVSRDDIQEIIQNAVQEALDSLELDGIGNDGDSVYEVEDSSVEVGR